MVLCEQNLAQTKFIGRKRMKINKIAMQKSWNNAEIMEKNHEHTHTHTLSAYWNTFLQSQWIIRWGKKNAGKNNNKNGINNKNSAPAKQKKMWSGNVMLAISHPCRISFPPSLTLSPALNKRLSYFGSHSLWTHKIYQDIQNERCQSARPYMYDTLFIGSHLLKLFSMQEHFFPARSLYSAANN